MKRALVLGGLGLAFLVVAWTINNHQQHVTETVADSSATEGEGASDQAAVVPEGAGTMAVPADTVAQSAAPAAAPPAPPATVQPAAPARQASPQSPTPQVPAQTSTAQASPQAPTPQVPAQTPTAQASLQAPTPQVPAQTPTARASPQAPAPQVPAQTPTAQASPQAPAPQASSPAKPEASVAAVPAKPAAASPPPAAKDAAVALDPAVIVPSFDVVRVNPMGDAVIAGRAAPQAKVTVLEGGRALGTVEADRRGEWVFLPNGPLASGARELSLQAEHDGVAVPSDNVVVIVVPERNAKPADPSSQALAVMTPRDGGASTPLQVPGSAASAAPGAQGGGGTPAAPAAGADVSVDIVDYDENGNVRIGGRGTPGAEVQLYLDNVLIGRGAVTEKGEWRLKPEKPVEPGTYTLRADQLGRDGRVAARVELPFQRAPAEQAAQAVQEVASRPMAPGQGDAPAATANIIVQPGNSLWRIARQNYGRGMSYTVIYQANRSQIRDPDLIYPGQIFTVPKSP